MGFWTLAETPQKLKYLEIDSGIIISTVTDFRTNLFRGTPRSPYFFRFTGFAKLLECTWGCYDSVVDGLKSFLHDTAGNHDSELDWWAYLSRHTIFVANHDIHIQITIWTIHMHLLYPEISTLVIVACANFDFISATGRVSLSMFVLVSIMKISYFQG